MRINMKECQKSDKAATRIRSLNVVCYMKSVAPE